MATQINSVSAHLTDAPAKSKDTFLRRALLADAVFETICGIGAIVAANALAEWTGLLSATGFTVLGVGFLIAAAFLYWMAFARKLNVGLAQAVMIANDAFVLVGIVLLVAFWSSLADGARWLIALVTIDVGILAALEFVGLRKLQN